MFPSTNATPFGYQFVATAETAADMNLAPTPSPTIAATARGSDNPYPSAMLPVTEASIASGEFLKNFESLVMRAVNETDDEADDGAVPLLDRAAKTNPYAPGSDPAHSDNALGGGSIQRTGATALLEQHSYLQNFVTHDLPVVLPASNPSPVPSLGANNNNMSTANNGSLSSSQPHLPPPAYQANVTTASVQPFNISATATSNGGMPAFLSPSSGASSPRCGGAGAYNANSNYSNGSHTFSASASTNPQMNPLTVASVSDLSALPGLPALPTPTAPPATLMNSIPHKSPSAPIASQPVLDPNDEEVRSNLFVCNLPQEVDDDRLKKIFSKYGTIESAKVMLNIRTGQSRGIAFVKFATVASAEAALAELNESDIFSEEQRLIVRVANAKAAYLPGAPTNKTFIRNVPTELTKEDLVLFFSQFGEVVDVSVHADTAGENAAAAAAAAAAGVILPSSKQRKISVAPILAASAIVSSAGHAGEDSNSNSHPTQKASSQHSDSDDALDSAARSGTNHNHSSSAPQKSSEDEAERDDKKLNIVFVTFAEKESARRAAEATHKKMPFKECNGVPLLSKVAEDNLRRNERLNRKFARVGTPSHSANTSHGGNNNNNNNNSSSLYGTGSFLNGSHNAHPQGSSYNMNMFPPSMPAQALLQTPFAAGPAMPPNVLGYTPAGSLNASSMQSNQAGVGTAATGAAAGGAMPYPSSGMMFAGGTHPNASVSATAPPPMFMGAGTTTPPTTASFLFAAAPSATASPGDMQPSPWGSEYQQQQQQFYLMQQQQQPHQNLGSSTINPGNSDFGKQQQQTGAVSGGFLPHGGGGSGMFGSTNNVMLLGASPVQRPPTASQSPPQQQITQAQTPQSQPQFFILSPEQQAQVQMLFQQQQQQQQQQRQQQQQQVYWGAL